MGFVHGVNKRNRRGKMRGADNEDKQKEKAFLRRMKEHSLPRVAAVS